MNKIDLIKVLHEKTGLTHIEAHDFVDIFFDEISKSLAKEDRVEIRGVCSFCVKHYKSYAARNPKTGEPVQVPEKRLPFFKCGKDLRNRVNNNN